MAEEHDRLSRHIDELIHTRGALERVMATARAYRETLRATAAC